MGSNWEAIGFTRWPISFCFAVLVILAIWSALKLFRSDAKPDLRTKAWLDGVLVFGALAFLLGILGAISGIILSLQAVEAAGAMRGPVMAPGIKVTLLSSSFGTVTFLFAVFIWYVLQLRWRLLEAASAESRA
jgi:hypothetical protein